MKTKMMTIATKVTVAIMLAATMLTAAPVVVRADAIDPQAIECVETNEVEGQGDVIDDEFAYVEGQGDVIDDEFAVTEGWGDVIDDEFAVTEGWGDVIDDEFAYVEGQGDVIDDEFAYVEGQGDVIDDKYAAAPVVDMGILNKLFGYHGTRVDYEDLVPGEFYLMQIPGKSKLPTFSYKVVKINESYTNKGIIFDDVMVKYDSYDKNGNLVGKNKETQVNENLLNMKPNHFYKITDDILAK